MYPGEEEDIHFFILYYTNKYFGLTEKRKINNILQITEFFKLIHQFVQTGVPNFSFVPIFSFISIKFSPFLSTIQRCLNVVPYLENIIYWLSGDQDIPLTITSVNIFLIPEPSAAAIAREP